MTATRSPEGATIPVLEESGPTCGGLRQSGCAVSDGYRYYVAGNPSANSAVVIDLGGPGLALGSADVLDSFVEALPKPLLDEYRLIALEEPWTYKPNPSSACEKAAEQWLREGRATLSRTSENSLAEAASRMRQACDPELEHGGWNPMSYRAAVTSALQNEDVALDGYIGASFGSVRRLYLDEAVSPAWTILVDPAPPDGSLGNLLRDRAAAANQALADYCPGCSDHDVAAAAAALDANPVAIEGRSLPVSGADLRSAIAVGAKQPQQIQQALALATGGAEQTIDVLRVVAQTSDAAWGRFGTLSVAPSSLAYYSEVCAAYPGEAPAEPSLAIGSALSVLHSPCKGEGSGLPAPRIEQLCIVAHKNDVIAGPATERWLGAYPDAVVHELSSGPHGSPDVVECWKEPS